VLALDRGRRLAARAVVLPRRLHLLPARSGGTRCTRKQRLETKVSHLIGSRVESQAQAMGQLHLVLAKSLFISFFAKKTTASPVLERGARRALARRGVDALEDVLGRVHV
jgi:hypothetical protein